MLLVLTGREDATATYLTEVLAKREVPFLRLDTEDLIARAAFRYARGRPALRIERTWYEPAAGSVAGWWEWRRRTVGAVVVSMGAAAKLAAGFAREGGGWNNLIPRRQNDNHLPDGGAAGSTRKT